MTDKNYLKDLSGIFSKIQVTDKAGKALAFSKAMKRLVGLICSLDKENNKVMFIGNGGSASIASHMATDFLKNGLIPALAFNDPSAITCLANDLGYESIFQKPLELLARRGDILFAISSSGKSCNILNAVKEVKRRRCFLVTLSGFNKDNPLRKSGDINFYIPFESYGYVEITHLAICHCLIDTIIESRR